MKLVEIANQQSALTVTQKRSMEFLENSIEGTWRVSKEGRIDVDGNVYVSHHVRILPVPFGEVTGNFRLASHPSVIESFENFPTRVCGMFYFTSGNITSFDGLQCHFDGDVDLANLKFESYHNIHEHILSAPRISIGPDDAQYVGPVLGFLLIEGLEVLYISGVPDKVERILNQHLDESDVAAAQEALIDAGLARYAYI